MKLWAILLPVVLVVLVSGCTGSTPQPQPTTTTSGGVRELSVAITHTGGYSPNTFSVKKGETVRFLATSDPVVHNHGIAIDEFNVNQAVTAGAGGTPQAVEFVADKAGTFRITCKSCEAGPLGPHPNLIGTLTVTE